MLATAMVLILSSIAVVSYQKVVQIGKESTCEANLKVLNGAVDAYVAENYAVPAVLGDLKRKHFEKAYAKVMNDTSWLEKFTQLVARTKLSRDAHAQFLTFENLRQYTRLKKFFACPSDENGGTSYGINDNVKGMRWFDISDNVIIVGDCDTATFDSISDLRARHGRGDLALAMTKGETLVKVEDGVVAAVASGGAPTVVVAANGIDADTTDDNAADGGTADGDANTIDGGDDDDDVADDADADTDDADDDDDDDDDDD
jgi:hypothetical protein